MGINIAKDKIWRMMDKRGEARFYSLTEILRSNDELVQAPIVGSLAVLQHELQASILQHSIDSHFTKGIDSKKLHTLTSTENLEDNRKASNLLQIIIETLESMSGFNLFGLNAFMQMPHSWRHQGQKEPISNLLSPLIPSIGKPSKGLRRLDIVPCSISESFCALCLFAYLMFAKSKSQYWSTGCFANSRTLCHFYFGNTIRQQLFGAVIPNNHPAWNPLQLLPWFESCLNNGGLDIYGSAPLLKYIQGKKITSVACHRFYLSRGVVLGPSRPGTCSITGKDTQVIDYFHTFSDQEIYTLLLNSGIQKKKFPKKSPGILREIYSPDNIHPSTVNIPLKDNAIRPWDTQIYFENYMKFLKRNLTNGETNRNISSIFKIKYASNRPVVNSINSITRPSQGGHLSQNNKKADYICILLFKHMCIFKKSIISFSEINKEKHTQYKEELQNTYRILQYVARNLMTNSSHSADQDEWEIICRNKFKSKLVEQWHLFLDKNEIEPNKMNRKNEIYSISKILNNNNSSQQNDTKESKIRPVIRAARAYAGNYTNLSDSERYYIHKASDPMTTSAFWRIIKIPQSIFPNLHLPLYIKILPILSMCQPTENNVDLGGLFKLHNHILNDKKIEFFLQEDKQHPLIEELTFILSMLARKDPIKIDYGILIDDLTSFHFRPDRTKRKWATSYFQNHNINEDE